MINMAARTGMQRELMRARPRGTYAITHHGFCLVWLMVCACVLASVCTHRERGWRRRTNTPTHQSTLPQRQPASPVQRSAEPRKWPKFSHKIAISAGSSCITHTGRWEGGSAGMGSGDLARAGSGFRGVCVRARVCVHRLGQLQSRQY